MTKTTAPAAKGAHKEGAIPTRLQRIQAAQKGLEELRRTMRELNNHLLATSASIQRQLERLQNQLR